MNEQMQKQFYRRPYPLVRYLSLLLAVALLFAGVTFARYVTDSGIGTGVGIAAFDATYSIDGVNSTTFGNQDYYIEANGSYVPLGTTALSVQMTLQNNGDTDVASTVTMRGPAEYWDNLAVQIASSDPSGDAGSSLTPQFVLRDLLYARKGSGNTAVYGAYKAWNGEQIDTEAYFLDYGERADTEERTLTMRGSLAEGPAREVIAAWTDGEGETNTLRITAREETQRYDVGFARKDGSDILPPVYVECEKKMTVYTLEFTLPALGLAKKTAQGAQEKSLVLFLNWTKEIVNTSVSADYDFWNFDMRAKQKFSFENQAVVGGGVVSTGEEITVLGYHYDVTGVPVVDTSGGATGETTTVRVRHIFGETAGDMQTEYRHVASLNDRDGNYAHGFAPVAENSDIYQCQNKVNADGRVCIDVSAPPLTEPLTGFGTVTLVSISDPANPGSYLKENYAPIYQRGFLVTFAAVFVQDSESPAAAAQP